MKEPTWARVHYPRIDYQDLHYYAAPKHSGGPNSLDEVDPEILATYERLGIPLKERAILAGVNGSSVAVDAVIGLVQVAKMYMEMMRIVGVSLMPDYEAP